MKLSKKQVRSELARRSLIDFAKYTSTKLTLTPFHESYYRVLDAFAKREIRRLIVTIPPQHGKSMGSSLLLPSYILGTDPDAKIALASYNLSLASRFNRAIQRYMDSEVYHDVFPRTRLKTKGQRNSNLIRTGDEFNLDRRDGGVLSVGREGSLTGNRVDVFILDDLYKDALEANSPLIRDHSWEWYNSVVKTRLHNDSQELILFTRWHEDDLIGRIEAHERVVELKNLSMIDPSDPYVWYKLNFEAIKRSLPTELDPRAEGEPLWGERHSLSLLENKRRLDTLMFETMYQGCPSLREGLLYGNNFSTYDKLPDDIVKRTNYTDTADTGEDFLCSICYSVGRDSLIYITDVVYSQQGMEITEGEVAQMLIDNDSTTARIESNNGGRGFARAIGKLAPSVRVEWFHQSHNKEARILSNSTTVVGRVVMPMGWQVRWGRLYNDLTTYRRLFRSNRWHDAADAITGVVEAESCTPKNNIKAIRFRN